MATPTVLLVYKRSAYLRLRLGGGPLGWLRKREFKSYVQILKNSHWNHYRSLAIVKEALKNRGLEVVSVLREEMSRVENTDGRFGLVVVVGGDGTFLEAAHWTGRVPILGVNSDPSRSVARFSACRALGFTQLLEAWATGKVKPVRVPRMSVAVNGKTLQWPVLNEVLVAAKSPAGTSRYLLKVGKTSEEQISSGVWVSTAAGSTAAILSAGGKPIPYQKEAFQYLVREPFEKKFGRRRLLKGVLAKGKTFEVVSHMKEGVVFLDGCSLCMPLGIGDKVRISLSAPPLSIIGMKPFHAEPTRG
jgi:NAD+ kinase